MKTANVSPQEEWIRVLGKGMITIPKNWRDELNIEEGEMIKAKKLGDKLIIEKTQKATLYRIFSNKEIKQWLKEDNLDLDLSTKIDKKFNLK